MLTWDGVGEGEGGRGLLDRSGGRGGGPALAFGLAIMASAAGGGGGRGRASRRLGWLAFARRAMSRARLRSWKVWNTGGSYATLGIGWGIGTVGGGGGSIGTVTVDTRKQSTTTTFNVIKSIISYVITLMHCLYRLLRSIAPRPVAPSSPFQMQLAGSPHRRPPSCSSYCQISIPSETHCILLTAASSWASFLGSVPDT